MYSKLERMIKALCNEWNRELFDSICDMAYENGWCFCWDGDKVYLEDEQFTLSYNLDEI